VIRPTVAQTALRPTFLLDVGLFVFGQSSPDRRL